MRFRPSRAFVLPWALLALPLNLSGRESAADPLARASASRGPASSPACVLDVKAAFDAIEKTDGEKIKVETDEFIAGKSYTMAPWNKLGLDNHFQGIQMLEDPRFVAFSGANIHSKQASLFIAEIALDAKKDAEPRIVARLDIGTKTFWHAGGLSRAGHILAVPIEAYKISKTSVVQFYDVSVPSAPKLVHELPRPHFDAGATALTRLADGRFLLIAFSNGIYEFYRSKTGDVSDGFAETAIVRRDWSAIPSANGSNLNFIEQCDGKKFLVTFRNTGKAPPVILNGRDLAGLLAFDWNDGDPKIAVRDEKRFVCHSSCNFAGAAGARVTETGGLSFYSTYTFRGLLSGKLRMKIFSE